MTRILARWTAEIVVFVGALIEIYLFASLLPGDSVDLPVGGTLVTMLLIGAVTAAVAIPLWSHGRKRDRA